MDKLDIEPCHSGSIQLDSWHRKLQEETVGNYSLPQRCPEINDAPDGLHVHENWHWDCPHWHCVMMTRKKSTIDIDEIDNNQAKQLQTNG